MHREIYIIVITLVLTANLLLASTDTIIVSPPYINICSNVGGFIHEGDPDDWELGKPLSVGPSSVPSFPSCWATKKSSSYSPNSNSILYLPMFDISGVTEVIFDWWQWYETDSGHDGGLVEISTNEGYGWSVIEPDMGYPCSSLASGCSLSGKPAFSGSSGDWEYQSIELTPYIGHGLIWLRFYFAANDTDEKAGWYIDDIGLHETYGALTGYVDIAYQNDNSGAVVRIVEFDALHSDTTDSSGYYFIDSIAVGNWTIECSKDSYATQIAPDINITRNDTIELDFSLSPILITTNFDTNRAGGVASPSDGWQWGCPDSATIGAPFIFTAHSDSFCWATRLYGNYTCNADWKLDFTVFLAAENPYMEFWQWYRFQSDYFGMLSDGGNVKVKRPSEEDWTIVFPTAECGHYYDGVLSEHNEFMGGQHVFSGDEYGNYWHRVEFDISEWAEDTAIIRFEIATDGAVTNRGWYIDDLIITDSENRVTESYKLPTNIALKAYPNPFNTNTTIEYRLPEPSKINIEIYNITGRLVKTLKRGDFSYTGKHIAIWDGQNDCGEDVPTGVYLAYIRTERQQKSLKLLFVK